MKAARMENSVKASLSADFAEKKVRGKIDVDIMGYRTIGTLSLVKPRYGKTQPTEINGNMSRM